MDIKAAFTNLVNAVAPPLPEQVGGVKLRAKVNSILAPTLLNTWLPPLPKALANNSVVQAISPRSATQGPPFPSGLLINWPTLVTNYFAGGIKRTQKEGLFSYLKKGPSGLLEEIGWLAGKKK